MKNKNILIIGLFVFVILGITSCNKKFSPALIKNQVGSNYDKATFNYIYVEGIKLKLMGNPGDALKCMEKCIKLNPGSDAALFQLSQIALMSGDLENGKNYALRAININEKNIWYLMMLANIYYQEKKADSAIIYYERAVKYFPEKEDLQLALGNIYSENKEYIKAKNVFEYLEKKYGINNNYTIPMIKNLISAGDYKEAENKILLLMKQFPEEILYKELLAEIFKTSGEKEKAKEVYRELMDQSPENPQIQLSICDFLIEEKNYSELVGLLNTVIINSNISRDDKISLFVRIIDNNDLVDKLGNELELELMILESTYRNDDIIILLRPELYIKQKRLTQASLRLEEIITIKQENYYAWEKLLFLYAEQGDYDKLFIKGKECTTRFNRSFLAEILYANAAIEKKEYSIANEELKKANILAGDKKELIVQVLTMEADLFYRMKDYKKSFETFDKALKINSEDLTIINNYAYYLAEQNQELKEAEKMARKVIEIEKENTTFLDTYAWVLYKRGKLNESEKIMETIIKSGEKPDAVWFEHYGYILKKQRNCNKAIENWGKALEMDNTKTELKKEIENCKK
jgi:Tfp pilus assembly protein PilF